MKKEANKVFIGTIIISLIAIIIGLVYKKSSLILFGLLSILVGLISYISELLNINKKYKSEEEKQLDNDLKKCLCQYYGRYNFKSTMIYCTNDYIFIQNEFIKIDYKDINIVDRITTIIMHGTHGYLGYKYSIGAKDGSFYIIKVADEKIEEIIKEKNPNVILL